MTPPSLPGRWPGGRESNRPFTPPSPEASKKFWARTDQTPGHGRDGDCWIWMGARVEGYGCLYYGGRTRRASQVAWELTHGAIPRGLCVLHTCDNRPCVRPEHLWLGTPRDNTWDAVLKGRHVNTVHPELLARGEQNGFSKLTEDAVLRLRQLSAEGHSTRQLAEEFGMSEYATWAAIRGRTWAHLPGARLARVQPEGRG